MFNTAFSVIHEIQVFMETSIKKKRYGGGCLSIIKVFLNVFDKEMIKLWGREMILLLKTVTDVSLKTVI